MQIQTLSRREFLRLAGAVPFALALPDWMPRLAFAPANSAPRGDVLLVIFLRGAADTLNMIVPHGEQAYYALRPTLGIARPDDLHAKSGQRVIDLDGFFGFHPALAPLLPAWQQGDLAIVHACGAPDESRSHFKAMALMERGVENERGPASGWIGRHLASLDTGNHSPMRAIGLGEMPQRSLYGSVPVSALRSIADFHLGGDVQATVQMRAALSALYTPENPLGSLGQETLDILQILQKLNPGDIASGITHFPDSDFGRGLRQIAMLVKAEVGLEVAAIDLGGWDTHFAQGVTEGQMPGLMADLAAGLSAFYTEMQDHLSHLSVVVMTEFGRRAYENASLGTDHGHGGVMLLLGGNLEGGKVHGRWPGLDQGQLFGPGDLAVTTDYRDVLAELCQKRLNNPALEVVFPGYRPEIGKIFK
jgi:uncharacterized protein (DUF1501 family)